MAESSLINGGVRLHLDRPRRMVLDLNAMILIQERLGVNILEGERVTIKSVRDARFFVWVLLIHEDPTLTEEQVGALISMDRMEEISAALEAAFTGGMPRAQATEAEAEDTGKAVPLPSPLTGLDSGPLVATTSA